MKRVLLVCLALILFLAVSCAPEAEQPPSNNEQEEKPPVDSGNETEEPKEETNSSNISGIVGESGAYTIPESIFKVEKTLSYALENIDKGVKSGSSLSFTNLKVAEGVILNGTIETSSTRALEEKNVEINLSLKEGEEEILVSYNAEAEVGENFELSNVKTKGIEAQIGGKKVEGIGLDYKPVSLVIADYIVDIKELVVEYSNNQSIETFSSSNDIEFTLTSDSWFDSAKKIGSVLFSFPGDKFLHNVDFAINADDSVSITIDGWANENNSGTGFVVSKEPAVRPENAKYSDEDALTKVEKAFSMYVYSNFDYLGGGVSTINRKDDEKEKIVTFEYNAYDASYLYGETTIVDGTYVYDMKTCIGTCNLSITGENEKYTVELKSIVDEKSLISGYYDIIKIDGENYSYLKNVLYRSTVKISYGYNELFFFLKDILNNSSSPNVTNEENKYTFMNYSFVNMGINIKGVNGELVILENDSFTTSFSFTYGDDKVNFTGSGKTETKESGDKIPSSWATFSLKELGETTEEQIRVINAILGKFVPILLK